MQKTTDAADERWRNRSNIGRGRVGRLVANTGSIIMVTSKINEAAK